MANNYEIVNYVSMIIDLIIWLLSHIHSKTFLQFLNNLHFFPIVQYACPAKHQFIWLEYFKSSYQAKINSFLITSITRDWFLEFLNQNRHFCPTVHCHMSCKEQIYMSLRFQVLISNTINMF